MKLVRPFLLVGVFIGCLACGSTSTPTTPTTSTTTTQSTTKQPAACAILVWTCSTSGWGAIAFSQSTGASGYSYNYSTRALAESAAIGFCARSDCSSVAWFQNAGGALARAPTGQWGTGTGTSADVAEALALASCLAQ